MVTVKHTRVGGVTSVILKQVDGVTKVSCACCEEWLVVDFSGSSDGGYVSGSICSTTTGFFGTSCWCEGGFYEGASDRQHIETNVGLARNDGIWTSSVNFTVKAHMETDCYGEEVDNVCQPQTSTPGTLSVTYKGVTKSADIELIEALLESACSGFDVGLTITVYATALGDGSYFEIT